MNRKPSRTRLSASYSAEGNAAVTALCRQTQRGALRVETEVRQRGSIRRDAAEGAETEENHGSSGCGVKTILDSGGLQDLLEKKG